MKQTSFSFLKDYKKEFGGSLLLGKRKTRRPLSTKAPIHLILKASQKRVFSPSNRSLHNLIRKTAKQFDVHVYDLAVNWSHIHFLIRIKSREDYVRFIRALSSLLSQAVAKVQSNRDRKNLTDEFGLSEKFDSEKTKLFTLRPFTRILSWGRDLKTVFRYVMINQMEAFGLVRRPKKTKTLPELMANRRRRLLD